MKENAPSTDSLDQCIQNNDNDLALYLKALDSTYSGIIITDNLQYDNPIIYCNKAFETISGYSQNEIIGHNCRFLQAQDRSQNERYIIKESIERGEECKIEIRNYRKDGSLFWNELFISPLKNDEGQVTHFIGVQYDINDRKKAAHQLCEQKSHVELKILERTKELQDKESILSSIIETVRESLLVLDANYKVLSANRHFLNSFKVSMEETVGKVLFDLGNQQWDISALKEMLTQILPTNNPVVAYEVDHLFPHIGRKVMLLNAFRIEFEGQYKDRILIAIEDITEKREQDLRKDDFLTIASHELRTPLTTIKGLSQILVRLSSEYKDPTYISTLDKITSYIERLNGLIATLLDTSKIQSGNIELHMEPFEIDKTIQDAIENMRSAVPESNIQYSGFTDCMVIGDELQVIQVVNNLLSNAIKYSPNSKNVEVNIDKVANFVKICVRDYGMGINYEDKLKIFERFFRVRGIQKKFPGLGIGLYISHQIIINHGGTLWVESELGEGSTFSFTLPILNNNE